MLTAYVVNYFANTVTPISTATGKAREAITVGSAPGAIAITLNGKTVYVYSDYYGTVTPIRTATGKALKAIKVGTGVKGPPPRIAITPNGKTVYVTNAESPVFPIWTATNTVGKPIAVGIGGGAIAITP